MNVPSLFPEEKAKNCLSSLLKHIHTTNLANYKNKLNAEDISTKVYLSSFFFFHSLSLYIYMFVKIDSYFITIFLYFIIY